MAFTVRDLTKEDRPGWENLWGGYLDFYRAPVDAVVGEVTWSRLLDPNELVFALVAADQASGDLTGFAHYVLHRGTWSIGHLCYLEDLYVAPRARRHGVGAALIDAVAKRADERKCERIYWLTHETNATAQRLYDRLARRTGFIQYRL